MTQHPERETPEETEGIRVHDRRRIDPDTFEPRAQPSKPICRLRRRRSPN